MTRNENKLSKPEPLVPEERRRQIADLVQELGSVTVSMLESEFGISPMTARRDLVTLEQEGRVRRTHGGAVLPGFAGHEDSFQRRMEEEPAAKKRLAKAAVSLLESGETVFIDSSTTAYHAAREILSSGLRITLLTNSLPVMELFTSSDAPNVELVNIGGSLRKLTLSFVGPHAVRTAAAHFTDKAILSIKGITPSGYLTDPDPLEAEVKRTVIEHSTDSIVLADGSKFDQRGLCTITHVSQLTFLLSTDAPEERVEAITEAGVGVRSV